MAEYEVFQVTARGVILKARERYAYYDSAKKEWDFTSAVDLRPRRHGLRAMGQVERDEKDLRVEAFWRHLRRNLQAWLKVYGFVLYDEILLIDVNESTVGTEIDGAGHLKALMTNFAGREVHDDEAVVVYETCRVILPIGAKAPESYLSEFF